MMSGARVLAGFCRGTRFDWVALGADRAMFIERLLNQGNAPLLEQTLKFTAARQKLLTENARAFYRL